MEKLAGLIKSKNSKKKYFVKWNSKSYDVHISEDKLVWSLVYSEVKNIENATKCAQLYIDSQPEIY